MTVIDVDIDESVLEDLDSFEPPKCEMFRCKHKPAHEAAWFAVKTCGCHTYSCDWARTNWLEDTKIKCGFCQTQPVEADFKPVGAA